VTLTGFQANPVPYYQNADFFVFPSLHEGSALVTYEALACGLPTITTRNAGSVVRDGREGYLVPIRSPEGLAAAMEALRQDQTSRRAMGIAARRRAQAFTWRASGDALARVLTDWYRGQHEAAW
jgi:glycosyltransferase involved in cell wall biosynthesis